ncbi:MAG TPA: hypothetical protein VHC49_18780 [Mycobacteriales bacterium]|nr:hypothetical protein [Mycobacteriales bacterium]
MAREDRLAKVLDYRRPGSRLLAARRLARMRTPAAARILAGELARDEFAPGRSARLDRIAYAALAEVHEQDAVDAVCTVWWRSRNREALGRLIRERGWIASAAEPHVRMRTAIHVGRADALAGDGRRVAGELIDQANRAPDPALRRTAGEILRTMRDPDTQRYLCEYAFEHDHAPALDAAVATGFLPEDAGQRAALLFLADDRARYRELDFDGRLLQAVITAAGPVLRQRLAAQARATGRIDWVGAAPTVADRTAEEWETLREILVGARRWEQLWSVVLEAPPVHAARMLGALAESGWRPDELTERPVYEQLLGQARGCRQHPVARELTGPAAERSWVSVLTFAPDGCTLISGTSQGRVSLWRDAAPIGQLEVGQGAAFGLAITADSGLLVTASAHEIRAWHLPGCTEAAETVRLEFPQVLIVGGLLVTGGPTLRRLPSMRTSAELRRHRSGSRLIGSPDGTLVAVLDPGHGGGTATLWRPPSTPPVGTFSLPGDPTSLAISTSGELLASGDDDGTIRLWQVPSGEPAGTLTGHQYGVADLSFTRDDRLLVSREGYGTVRWWDVASGRLGGSVPGGSTENTRIAVTPDGSLLACGRRSGELGLWWLPSGEPAGFFAGHADAVSELATSPDGGQLATGGRDGSVRLWLPRILPFAHTPIHRIDPARVAQLRLLLGRSEVERPWIELISGLVRHRRRFDIEVSAEVPAPAAADIEVDGG